jgi:hypothetical protein
MLLSGNRTLEDRLVEYVLKTPGSVRTLHDHLQRDGVLVTQRAVYKAVKQLVKGGVVLKAGGRVRIDQEWARMVRERLAATSNPLLACGEKMTYTFTSLPHLDAFWKTVMLELESTIAFKEIFFYNPHNFWAYMPERKESEDQYYAGFKEATKHGYFVVGGTSAPDIEFKTTYQNPFFQIDARNIGALPRTDHVSVFGDFVLTVRLSKKLATQIDAVYARSMPREQMVSAIADAWREMPAARFSLENNPAKANRLRRMLSKNFVRTTTI